MAWNQRTALDRIRFKIHSTRVFMLSLGKDDPRFEEAHKELCELMDLEEMTYRDLYPVRHRLMKFFRV